MVTSSIGIVGLGKMGSAFARRFLEQHFQVSVWDHSPERVTAFNAPGAIPYTSLGDLVAGVNIVVVSLWDDEVARKITLAQVIPAMHPPQILVEISTLSPHMYETLERAAGEQNVAFVASPVLGNPEAVRQGALTVLPGGAKETVQRLREMLSALGTVIEMPSVRASAYLKLANNTILGVVAETLGELLDLCERGGIDRDIAVRSLTGTFQRSSQQKVPQLLARDSEPRFALSALIKDLHLAHEAASSVELPISVLDAVLPHAQHAQENGLGDRDYIVLALDRTGQAAVKAAS